MVKKLQKTVPQFSDEQTHFLMLVLERAFIMTSEIWRFETKRASDMGDDLQPRAAGWNRNLGWGQGLSLRPLGRAIYSVRYQGAPFLSFSM